MNVGKSSKPMHVRSAPISVIGPYSVVGEDRASILIERVPGSPILTA